MYKELQEFSKIILWDTEYKSLPGERVIPHYLEAYELRSGKRARLWFDQTWSKFPSWLGPNPDSLFVAFNCAAEFSFLLALGRKLPIHNLDLSQEFKCQTNGHALPDGIGLLGALSHYGLNSISVAEKEEMRLLAMRGGPFTDQERTDLAAYCQGDVEGVFKLLGAMWRQINLPQALLRGRFMRAVAITEFNGVSIDVEILRKLRENWDYIKLNSIFEVDKDYGVFEGTHFKLDRFAGLLRRLKIRNWPKTEVGRLSKSDETFKKMSQAYPVLQPLRELLYTISKLRLERLAVGPDARNRTQLWAFSTKTGRNAPKASEYIFSPSTWIRPVIKPIEGFADAYVDYSSQEYGISGSLSNDGEMIKSYLTKDPYRDFAISCGAIPVTAAAGEYREIRNAYKQCCLGILYGMQAEGLATYSGQTVESAEKILENHRRVYWRFWQWMDEVLERALLRGYVETCYGWRFSAPWKSNKPDGKHRGRGIPVRTIKNFLVQASAAEMFRLACCLIVERGVKLCAMVHDAVLIEAPVDEIDEAVSVTRQAMAEASLEVLKGRLEIRTDYKVFTDRFADARGQAMWDTVMRVLETLDQRRRTLPKQEQLGLWL